VVGGVGAAVVGGAVVGGAVFDGADRPSVNSPAPTTSIATHASTGNQRLVAKARRVRMRNSPLQVGVFAPRGADNIAAQTRPPFASGRRPVERPGRVSAGERTAVRRCRGSSILLGSPTVRIATVVSFRDEIDYLPTFLASMAAQTRPPDEVILVDDGSVDDSLTLAESFSAQHHYARTITRPRRAPERDRMVHAPELSAFLHGVEQLSRFDVVVKMDADLRLSPDLFAELERRFEVDPCLGIAGAYLRAPHGATLRREPNPAYHVRGPNKFYRRECLEQILPLPMQLGWDTIDEIRARMCGWHTQSFSLPSGDPVHLRPTGSLEGVLRGYRRDGQGAWTYGAAGFWIVLGACKRLRERPLVLGAAHYLAGWLSAAVRRVPRVDRETRLFVRREQRRRVKQRIAALLNRRPRDRRSPPTHSDDRTFGSQTRRRLRRVVRRNGNANRSIARACP
jgi:poly-beta-1,6-N-acetyl-D-glucosamine synthase